LLDGSWKNELNTKDKNTLKLEPISKIDPPPDKYEYMYGFRQFTIHLNHLTHEQISQIAPTDSRFRPDQRAYENGDVELASTEKHRLEELQRARRRLRKEKNEEYKPKWFTLEVDETTGEEIYKYKGGYFEASESGEWEQANNIKLLNLYNSN
jgi:hypothetical protein